MADTKTIIECPACGCEMTKLFLEEKGINVDICTEGCGGIFFDNMEFQNFDNPERNIDDILSVLQGKSFAEVDEREVRICPICNVSMVKQGAGRSGVTIDVCNTCGGKFLDKGELERIRDGKVIKDEKLDGLLEDIYERETKSLLGEQFHKKPLTENFRKAFEKFVYRNMMR